MSLWLIGGLDPTGGAGVLRDHFTASAIAPKIASHCVVTTWTRQGHGKPAIPGTADVDRLAAHLRRLPDPTAVKVGLIPKECDGLVSGLLESLNVPIVVDPVLRASDGGVLRDLTPGLDAVLSHASLITPNLDEAAMLCGTSQPGPVALEALAARFPHTSVLLTGGHGNAAEVTDWLAVGEARHDLSHPRWPPGEVRGTGCALATAITCALADGRTMRAAVEESVAWLCMARAGAIVGPDGKLHLPP